MASGTRELIKCSTIISVGVALARVLGFGFSLVLARLLSPDDYGFIQYSLTLAGLVTLLTMPFGQHVLARYVGNVKDQPRELDEFLATAWIILIGLVAVTLVIAVPVLLLAGRLSVGVLVVFLGFTLHYSYFGLARGFMASWRLMAAYLGSNVVQIIAIVIVYVVLGERGPMPALIIYGASYLLPIGLLQLMQPFPVRFRWFLPDRAYVRRILKFSAPVWVSHAAYIFYAGIDILLLERFLGTGAVGLYALTKTLTMLLSFVPTGLTTVLLPKVAAGQGASHRGLLRNSILISLMINALVLIVMLVAYRPFILYVFGEAYVAPLAVLVMLAFSEIAFGIQGIMSAVVVGAGQPQLETIMRVVVVGVSVVFGFVFIPTLGLTGAALTSLVGAISGIVTYGLASYWLKKDITHATVEVR
ncbi:MAG: oligosaccharide flippase family protein [Chloroflexi bacterium]|nr:oligosaccharide flippase family protein [Chloroflexota bacterium]